jgi:SAM-dependent methyltransferase
MRLAGTKFAGVMRDAILGISEFGEKHGIGWLTYNPLLFIYYHYVARKNAPPMMRAISQVFPAAQRYLDVGAGSGAFAASAARRGRQVWACEYSRWGRMMAQRQGVRSIPFDLYADPPADFSGGFDLAYSFEVAEHVPADAGDKLVEFIAAQAPINVFTAAHPGQGGTGHINEQAKEYWIERFERNGRSFRPELTEQLADALRHEGVSADYLVDNVMVFGG